jgi:exopolysaccharide production protein ExoQ
VSVAAWERPGAGEIRPDSLLSAAAAVASVGMLVIYSQAWVFPLIGEGGGAAAGGLVRTLFFPAYLVGAALFLRAPRAALHALARQPFLIVLMLIVGISALWSVAPDQTARRAFAVYCTTLGGAMLAVRYRWAQMAEIMAACFAVIAVIALLVALLVPSVGVMHELFPGAWRGVWEEKNALGGNMALGFVVLAGAAALNPQRAKIWIPFAALTLFLVLMSHSKTSLVSLLLGLGVLAFVAAARRGPAAGVASAWLAVLGLAMFAGLLLFAADLFFAVLGKDATFTGRTRIWSAALRQIAERPWTGYGYGVVWDQKGAWGPLAWIVRDAGFKPQHAHNAWIEQWLGLGVFGLVAYGLTMLQTLALGVISVFRTRGAYLAAPYLMVYGLMTMTESVSVVYNDLRWVLFVAIAVKLAWPDDAEA